MCAQELRLSHNCIFLVWVNLFTRSILHVFQNKSEDKVDSGFTFENPAHMIQFFVAEKDVQWWNERKIHYL